MSRRQALVVCSAYVTSLRHNLHGFCRTADLSTAVLLQVLLSKALPRRPSRGGHKERDAAEEAHMAQRHQSIVEGQQQERQGAYSWRVRSEDQEGG